MARLKAVTRRNAARMRAWRRRRHLEKHAADLGITPVDIDGAVGADDVIHRTGASDVALGYPDDHGGRPARADGRAYWFRDGIVYTVDLTDNPCGFPALPPNVDPAHVSRCAATACGETMDTFQQFKPERVAGLVRRATRLTGGPWAAIRNAYRHCESYRHTVRNVRTWRDTAPENADSEIAFEFKGPNHLRLVWLAFDDDLSEGGYVVVDGESVRYFDTR